ncbi:MAG: hypothetical protein NXH85_12550 [Pseudomonadaceae bacterium]|nr:hypothetical protein [Pseudomonadaceae bacterium]
MLESTSAFVLLLLACLLVAGISLVAWKRHRREVMEGYSEQAARREKLLDDVHTRRVKVAQLRKRIGAFEEESSALELETRDLDARISQLSERLNEKWQLGRKLSGVVRMRKQNLVGLEGEISRWQERLDKLRCANKDWALRQDKLTRELSVVKNQHFDEEDLAREQVEEECPALLDQAHISDVDDVSELKAKMQLMEGQLAYWQSKVSDLGFAVRDMSSDTAEAANGG